MFAERFSEFNNKPITQMDTTFLYEMRFELAKAKRNKCCTWCGAAYKMKDLLKSKGKLVGLLFDAKLNTDHPPFGGNRKEYTAYFESYFKMDVFTKCYNSFHNRQGMELFIKLTKN